MNTEDVNRDLYRISYVDYAKLIRSEITDLFTHTM